MTLQEIPSESFRERSIPVLETERLVLRAPRLGDAKAVAVLANDRRIAENTARIPHPYRVADAEDFIATANLGNEAVFIITLRNGVLIGACGFTQVDRHPPEIGYWLGVKHWGKGYATEAVRAVIDHIFTDLDCDAIQSAGARHQSGVAPRAGEVRLPVDRRGPAAHPRDLELGADRPLPPRPRPVGLAEKLGRGEARRRVTNASEAPSLPARRLSLPVFGGETRWFQFLIARRKAQRMHTRAVDLRPVTGGASPLCEARRRGDRTRQQLTTEVTMTPPGQFRR